MSQGLIPFQYEVEKQEGGMTALSGLPLYPDFIQLMGLRKLITDLIRARDGGRGYTDAEMIVTVALLNLAGGEAADLWGEAGPLRTQKNGAFDPTRVERKS